VTPDNPIVEGNSEFDLYAGNGDGLPPGQPRHDADSTGRQVRDHDLPSDDTEMGESGMARPAAWDGAAHERLTSPMVPPVNGIATPNEFTFGWRDLEMSDSETGSSSSQATGDEQPIMPATPVVRPDDGRLGRTGQGGKRRQVGEGGSDRTVMKPGRRSQPTDGAARPDPSLDSIRSSDQGSPLGAQVGRLAHQAAQSADPVAAVGLIAAIAPLVLLEDERLASVAGRLLPPLVRATAWVAWRLQQHPARCERLLLLPEAMRRVAATLHADAAQGRALPARLVAQLLLQELNAQVQRRVPMAISMTASSLHHRGESAAPRPDALTRWDRMLAEWWQDEPSSQ
jgi:hypothetical protein